MAEKKYTHVAVEPPTQRKVAILAKALDVTMYSLVEDWANVEWMAAKKAGLVTDAMLNTSTSKAEKAG